MHVQCSVLHFVDLFIDDLIIPSRTPIMLIRSTQYHYPYVLRSSFLVAYLGGSLGDPGPKKIVENVD